MSSIIYLQNIDLEQLVVFRLIQHLCLQTRIIQERKIRYVRFAVIQVSYISMCVMGVFLYFYDLTYFCLFAE